jgi:septation ring formation regulator EzrA
MVEALRKTAKALDVRRSQLAAEDAPGHLSALAEQRRTLAARRDAAQDFQVKAKLEAALRSLDGQETALRQLIVASERVEGEYTSLLVLLQELRTRVAVARSTTSSVQLGGLEQSVERLNAELSAITESLQATQASPFTAVDELGLKGESTEVPGTREQG